MVESFVLLAFSSDWVNLDAIDIPLSQRSLSHAIDNFQCLLSTASSLSLPHANDFLIVVPLTALGLYLQDCKFHCCLQFWLRVVLHIIVITTLALNFTNPLTPSEIIKSHALATLTEWLGKTLSETSFWNYSSSCPGPYLRGKWITHQFSLSTCYYPIGIVAIQLL